MDITSDTFKNKTVLITGAASGLGKAMAIGFAEAGASVIVSDINDAGTEVASEINGEFIKADLSSMEETQKMCMQTLKLVESVDILVNNAGFQKMSPVEEFPDQLWSNMIQVMLISAFQTIKYFLPSMKNQGWGRIINISSIHGLVASPYKSAYNSAKHGLIGLTKTVALEAGQHGITVNAICPGYARTPIVESQIRDQANYHGIAKDEVVDQIILAPAAIKRLIEPDEISQLALFLASENARSITGSAYSIDAGWVAR